MEARLIKPPSPPPPHHQSRVRCNVYYCNDASQNYMWHFLFFFCFFELHPSETQPVYKTTENIVLKKI